LIQNEGGDWRRGNYKDNAAHSLWLMNSDAGKKKVIKVVHVLLEHGFQQIPLCNGEAACCSETVKANVPFSR
ncbi:hypothetical protein STEG23_015225, partial [Scotinomys teguina]